MQLYSDTHSDIRFTYNLWEKFSIIDTCLYYKITIVFKLQAGEQALFNKL